MFLFSFSIPHSNVVQFFLTMHTLELQSSTTLQRYSGFAAKSNKERVQMFFANQSYLWCETSCWRSSTAPNPQNEPSASSSSMPVCCCTMSAFCPGAENENQSIGVRVKHSKITRYFWLVSGLNKDFSLGFKANSAYPLPILFLFWSVVHHSNRKPSSKPVCFLFNQHRCGRSNRHEQQTFLSGGRSHSLDSPLYWQEQVHRTCFTSIWCTCSFPKMTYKYELPSLWKQLQL